MALAFLYILWKSLMKCRGIFRWCRTIQIQAWITDGNAASKSKAPAIGMFLGLLLGHSEYIMEYIWLHVSIATRLLRKLRPPVNPFWVLCVIFLKVCESAEQLAETIIWLSVFFIHSGRVDNGSLKIATASWSLSPFTRNAILETFKFSSGIPPLRKFVSTWMSVWMPTSPQAFQAA